MWVQITFLTYKLRTSTVNSDGALIYVVANSCTLLIYKLGIVQSIVLVS